MKEATDLVGKSSGLEASAKNEFEALGDLKKIQAISKTAQLVKDV